VESGLVCPTFFLGLPFRTGIKLANSGESTMNVNLTLMLVRNVLMTKVITTTEKESESLLFQIGVACALCVIRSANANNQLMVICLYLWHVESINKRTKWKMRSGLRIEEQQEI
jgi:hypothetical protein